MKKYAPIISVLLFAAIACCPEKKNENTKSEFPAAGFANTATGAIVADTIIYDVIIKNSNPDDTWTQECLKGLEKEQFIDQLFESIYNETLLAYKLENNQVISPDELKEMERKNIIDRDKIGKMQFTEAWVYNDSLLTMSKKVISVSLGSEVFDNSGQLLGYKHLFKLNFN